MDWKYVGIIIQDYFNSIPGHIDLMMVCSHILQSVFIMLYIDWDTLLKKFKQVTPITKEEYQHDFSRT